MTLDTLQTLMDELDAYRAAGMVAEFWWRDDDAVEPTVELDRLMAVSKRHAVACGLSVVPAKIGEPLRKTVSGAGNVWVLQHGYAHANHAHAGGDPCELGGHRSQSIVLDELRVGMLRLTQLFKGRFVPVLVPPWGRIAPELLPYLPVMGFRGLSSLYREHRPIPPSDLRVADVHCNILDFSDKPAVRFAGDKECVTELVAHLRAKRTGQADDSEPTGILTHHVVMDDDAWAFVETLFEVTIGHPAVQWRSPAGIWTVSE